MSDKKSIFKIFDVEGKTAIVTGGMGQLGTQYVKTLLEAGLKVAVFDIKIDNPNSFYLLNKKNPNLKIYKVDITKKTSIKNGLKKAMEQFGVPSVLINNAALDVPPGTGADENVPFEQYPEKSLDKTYEANLKGTILCCQIIGEEMADNKGGSIINISSIYGNVSPDQRIYEHLKKGNKGFFKPVSYSITKAGVLGLTRYLATYWAKKNVRVNSLTLGGVFNNQDKKFVENYSQRVPIGRMAEEDEYNGAILFLASDASSYMTGSNLIIDGGYTSW
ncbi:MAG: SDR family oxidoreductase [Nanoarchaeota archaeon]|nr:SDR family oxidoreductase [Nanoarchaeota archaeon]